MGDPVRLEAVTGVLKAWGVRSRNGEWTDEEAQVGAAKEILVKLDRLEVVRPADEGVWVPPSELERLQAAEEVCWSMMLWISLGRLESVELPIRRDIADNALSRWAELCAQQGLMRAEEEGAGD